MSLILFLILCYSLTNIIVNESVFRKVIDKIKSKSKFLNSVLGCSTCCGFYVGSLMYIFLVSLGVSLGLTNIVLVDMILFGIISSGIINIIEHIKVRIGY